MKTLEQLAQEGIEIAEPQLIKIDPDNDVEFMKKMKGGILTITNYIDCEEVKTPVKIFHHPVHYWTCIVIDDICTLEVLTQCLMFLEDYKSLKKLLKGFGVKHPNIINTCVVINSMIIFSIRGKRIKYELKDLKFLKFSTIKNLFDEVKSINNF